LNTSPDNPSKLSLSEHYNEAGPDYRYWSPNYNMHFGYWRWGLNPLVREPMLEELTFQAFSKLDKKRGLDFVELGCGYGGPLRLLAGEFPDNNYTGVSIIPVQIDKARELSKNLASVSLEFIEADYTKTNFVSESFDAVMSLEAFCHAEGLSKPDYLAEAHRILRPGATLLIADGFLTTGEIPSILRPLFNKVSGNWAVETFAGIPQVKAELEQLGFEDIEFENISLRIAPSVMHAPFVTMKWVICELFKSERVSSGRRKHITASLLSIIVGLAFPWFGYYILSARKT